MPGAMPRRRKRLLNGCHAGCHAENAGLGRVERHRDSEGNREFSKGLARQGGFEPPTPGLEGFGSVMRRVAVEPWPRAARRLLVFLNPCAGERMHQRSRESVHAKARQCLVTVSHSHVSARTSGAAMSFSASNSRDSNPDKVVESKVHRTSRSWRSSHRR
jgi:hypothetical protein